MRSLISLGLVALLLPSFPLLAQTVSPGKYSGQIEFQGPGGRQVRSTVMFNVEKVEGDQVHGVAWFGTPNCSVDTPVQGKLEGDTLKVRGAPVKERCGVNWELKVAGDKLEGKTSTGIALVLSK
jgi:hypothetical protein